jgi:hypothetical protein
VRVSLGLALFLSLGSSLDLASSLEFQKWWEMMAAHEASGLPLSPGCLLTSALQSTVSRSVWPGVNRGCLTKRCGCCRGNTRVPSDGAISPHTAAATPFINANCQSYSTMCCAKQSPELPLLSCPSVKRATIHVLLRDSAKQNLVLQVIELLCSN